MTGVAGALTAAEIIVMLGLVPHPEGGHYRETFRDATARPGGREASSAIYFLLAAGEVSRWHRIDAAEVWHWYAGAALALEIADDTGMITRLVLGSDLEAGARPQVVVPAGHWQKAESLGTYTLAGCTVAPAFQFSGFELAAPGAAPPGAATRGASESEP